MQQTLRSAANELSSPRSKPLSCSKVASMITPSGPIWEVFENFDSKSLLGRGFRSSKPHQIANSHVQRLRKKLSASAPVCPIVPRRLRRRDSSNQQPPTSNQQQPTNIQTPSSGYFTTTPIAHIATPIISPLLSVHLSPARTHSTQHRCLASIRSPSSAIPPELPPEPDHDITKRHSITTAKDGLIAAD